MEKPVELQMPNLPRYLKEHGDSKGNRYKVIPCIYLDIFAEVSPPATQDGSLQLP